MKFIDMIKKLFLGGGNTPQGGTNTESKDGKDEPTDIIGYSRPNNYNIDKEKYINTLVKHPIMVELKEWAEYRVKVLNIEDPMKRNMASYFLGLFFGELYNAIYKMIEEYETYLDDTIALNNLVISTIANVGATALANGVPKIFLDRITAYLYSQAKVLDTTYKDLDRYEYYGDALRRATFRLDLGFLTIRSITAEIEMIINQMNGELHAALEGSLFDQ